MKSFENFQKVSRCLSPPPCLQGFYHGTLFLREGTTGHFFAVRCPSICGFCCSSPPQNFSPPPSQLSRERTYSAKVSLRRSPCTTPRKPRKDPSYPRGDRGRRHTRPRRTSR